MSGDVNYSIVSQSRFTKDVVRGFVHLFTSHPRSEIWDRGIVGSLGQIKPLLLLGGRLAETGLPNEVGDIAVVGGPIASLAS